MVQHNIYLESARFPEFAFDNNPIAFGQTQTQQVKEIAWQYFAIARLNAEDWQQIGMAVNPLAAGSIGPQNRHRFIPSQVLQQTATALGQCLKLLALQNEDWQNMTNLLSRS